MTSTAVAGIIASLRVTSTAVTGVTGRLPMTSTAVAGMTGSLRVTSTTVTGVIASLWMTSTSVAGVIATLATTSTASVFTTPSQLTAEILTTYAIGGVLAMRVMRYGDGTKFGDPNARWGSPSYVLEPGDPGYVPPPVPPIQPTKKKGRKNVASNPTPDRIDELIAAGEDLYDGLNQHAVNINIKKNDPVTVRGKLDAVIATTNVLKAAQGAEPAAYQLLRTADSNAKGFIAAAIKVISLSLGNAWSDTWVATGLPDKTVGMPGTQDKRFAALGGLAAYFTANPTMEVTTPKLTVTAALAETRYQAVSDARQAVANALSNSATKMMPRDNAVAAFKACYRSAVEEIGECISDDDPRWYDFGLNRPADGAQPGLPMHVVASAIGSGRVLVQLAGARRANSFNYYRQITGTDQKPVKVQNTPGTQLVIDSLPTGATVQVTVTAVNDAGEGQASAPISVAVT